MSRGRPKQMDDRVTTSVSFEKHHMDIIKASGYGISEFVRECIELRIQTMRTPLEKLREEREQNIREIEERRILKLEQDRRIAELEDELAMKNEEELKANEFFYQRIELFNKKFRKQIYSNQICPVDFYSNVRKELKYEDLSEAKDWLYEMYNQPQEGCRSYSEDRIRTFLRYDTDLSRFW
jgi:hypothetical protein